MSRITVTEECPAGGRKSLKHVRYAYKNEWRCYAVKAARKNTDGSITVETMEDGIRYNMRLSRSNCLRGSCQNTIGYKTKNQAQDQRADSKRAIGGGFPIPTDANSEGSVLALFSVVVVAKKVIMEWRERRRRKQVCS